MHRSVIRVLLAAGIAAGGLVWTDAFAAAGKDIGATIDPAKCDKTWGPPCFTPANGTVTQIQVGDTVTWHATDGTHTVTPVDSSAFAGSGDLAGPDGTFSVTFDKPGVFAFYCKHHGSVDSDGKTHHGMWGKIDVKGADTTTTATTAPPPGDPPPGPPPGTTPPPNPPPTTNPTRQPAPPPSSSPPPSTSNGSTGSSGNGQTAAGTGRPWVGPPPTQAQAPPPTRVAASEPPSTEPPPKSKDNKDKKDGGNDNAVPEATAPPPDAAVLPPSPEFPTPTTAPLANPGVDVPHGDSIAVLKNEAGGRRRKLVMFGTIFGMGLFAAGVGGWKFTHRSSKYWPA